MAVNSRPVVGASVIVPRPAIAAKCIVSIVSFGEHVEPVTRTPPMHLTMTLALPGRTVPVRSAFVGLKIVWSASKVTEKPFRASEPCMKTETLSWLPAVPEKLSGLEGQDVAPDGMMQTSPTNAKLTETDTL